MRVVDGYDVFDANYIDKNNMTVLGRDQAVLKNSRDVSLISINVICHGVRKL